MFIGLNRLQYVCLFRQLIVNLCRSNRVGCLQIASLIRLSVNQRGKLDLLFGKEQFRLRHTIDSDDSIHGRWYSPSTCFGPLPPLWPAAIYFSSILSPWTMSHISTEPIVPPTKVVRNRLCHQRSQNWSHHHYIQKLIVSSFSSYSHPKIIDRHSVR